MSFARSRDIRKKKEYIYRKCHEQKEALILAKKQKLSQSLETGKQLAPHQLQDSESVLRAMEHEDDGPSLAAMLGNDHGYAPSTMDDEYRLAGSYEPRILLTTSHKPSARLQNFAKEMKLILPNSERINRGKYDMKSLIATAKSNGFTDFIMLHERSGKPNQMVVCHMPHGPTSYFTLDNVKLRHDIKDLAKMSEVYPKLIFHNFETRVGNRVKAVLKYLFPVPKDDCLRSMVFVNDADWILFRNFQAIRGERGVVTGAEELGPQFSMKCHKILRGTLDEVKAADVEFELAVHMNTAHKVLHLSKKGAWEHEKNRAERVDQGPDSEEEES